ncbi:response regulator transcription factor [Streptomyces sp. MBT53]|uniref:LuxR C-terminal-related transcriptional regulator n=1 Tax=Streptomyces sp. MBT53 TaxID=1488384 RepID=UPI0019132A84|nr:response regulator transcription factor [Streptomyces sp. MBT53]
MRSSERLVVVLASVGDTWPHNDWPAPDDQYVDRVVRVSPPYDGLGETTADVVVLHCEDPAASFPGLLDVLRTRGVPAIVVSARQDTDAVVEVFRAGAGYLVEGDHCPQMMSSAVLAATVGHTYLSPTACDALREGASRMAATDEAMERLRALLSPREQQIMELLSTGLGAQQIGQRLRLSEKTVRNNLSNIYAKLDARSGTDAVLRWLGATPVLRT